MTEELLIPISFCQIVGIFCCPPCPTQITEKLVFHPPHPPLYDLKLLDKTSGLYDLLLSPHVDGTGSKMIVKQEVRKVKTRLGNNIVVLYVNCNPERHYTLLMSHGIGADLGFMHRQCARFSLLYGCDVVAYDYSGYGRSGGRPREKNMYADIKAVWDCTLTFYESRAYKIILFGHSLGATATVGLASKVDNAGVVLDGPFISTMRVLCQNSNKFLSCLDRFRSIEKVPKVTSPVLVVHSIHDDIVPISHGREIRKHCPRAVQPLWLRGVGHDDTELRPQYVERLRKFINEEI